MLILLMPLMIADAADVICGLISVVCCLILILKLLLTPLPPHVQENYVLYRKLLHDLRKASPQENSEPLVHGSK